MAANCVSCAAASLLRSTSCTMGHRSKTMACPPAPVAPPRGRPLCAGDSALPAVVVGWHASDGLGLGTTGGYMNPNGSAHGFTRDCIPAAVLLVRAHAAQRYTRYAITVTPGRLNCLVRFHCGIRVKESKPMRSALSLGTLYSVCGRAVIIFFELHNIPPSNPADWTSGRH